jgi:nitroimidazol reductase NimA-like FMN-containing flavoprotein (pyridoxamine 5'-phosphate oxidase superfamily)
MNRRNQIQLTPEEQAKFLKEQQKCAFATLDKNGFPHMVAMNYAAKDGVIYMTSYGKAQKVVNVRRNPKVGVMVEAGKRYAELRGVMIRGYCEIIDHPQQVEAIARMVAGRPGGPEGTLRPTALNPEVLKKRVIMKVTPEKIATWDHSKLGGRY